MKSFRESTAVQPPGSSPAWQDEMLAICLLVISIHIRCRSFVVLRCLYLQTLLNVDCS